MMHQEEPKNSKKTEKMEDHAEVARGNDKEFPIDELRL